MFDLSPEELLTFYTLDIPSEDAVGGWNIDPILLAKVLTDLGIKLPVKIKYHKMVWTGGTHRNRVETRMFGWYHHIVINQRNGWTTANHALWHELAHAIQSEDWVKREVGRDPGGFNKVYKEARGSHGQSYTGNLFEVHAEKIAKTFAPQYPIIRRSR